MLDFFYTIIIYPLETVLGLFYGIFLKMFEIHGIAIVLLSAAVNILLLPLYNMAEKWQQTERDIQKKLKPKLDDIKAVFKGSERHMIISTYYRQNNYHPVYSLRNIIGLAIQVPFFIAAYHLLSHMPMTELTSSYYFLSDLRLEDNLIKLGSLSLNLLPILMTIVNLISAFVYSGKLDNKEKRQLVIMALLFLVLLYKSPSGLVLYWTLNNIFSLLKNIIYTKKNPAKIFYYILSGFLAFLFIYSILLRFDWAMNFADIGHLVFKNKKILKINKVTGLVFSLVFIVPFVFRYLNKFVDNLFTEKDSSKNITMIFITSCSILFILTGILIPSLLLANSPLEFTEKISGVFYNPVNSIYSSGLQAFSFFIFIPLVVYFLFSDRIKKYLAVISLSAASGALVNLFVFPGSYGVMSPRFTFDTSLSLVAESNEILLNVFSLIIIFAVLVSIIKLKKYKILINVLAVVLISVSSYSVYNIFTVNSEFNRIVKLETERESKLENQKNEKIFNFSKTGKNVFVMMLDRAMAGLMASILDHNPEFYEDLSGFTWYPNSLSFNGHTVLGVPGIWGGYEYTPVEMNKRDDMLLKDKHNESLLMMPRFFLEQDYEVNVTDPSIANYSWIPDLTIYQDYPEIDTDILAGKFSEEWIEKNINAGKSGVNNNLKAILNEYLMNFSVFRIMPNFTRKRLYDGSRWLKPFKVNLPVKFINQYSVLEKLPELTGFDSEKNTFNSTGNETVHEEFILQVFAKEEFNSTKIDSSKVKLPFDDKYTLDHFYTQIGALKVLCRWFDFLKENNAYDNTKIIIVADHGRDIADPAFADFSEDEKERNEYTFYHPLLLVKDFNSRENLKISDEFMTNADVPSIATSHIKDARNPFTGKLINNNYKIDGVDIVTIHSWRQERHRKYKFNFTEKDIIRVRDNLFDKNNWERAE